LEEIGMEKIGVLGCGLMGSGIALVSVQAGFKTLVQDVDQKFIDKAFARILEALSKSVQKGTFSEEQKDEALKLVHGTLNLEELKDCDLIIEAVTEDMELKKDLFSKLDALCDKKTILASNTSSLTIMAIAAATKRADRVCGLHFFNPVPVMKLVEVIKSIATSSDTVRACMQFCKQIGKTPILARDSSGFIVNRLLIPYLLDSIRVIENGLASITDVDAGMKLGLNHPRGPLTLMDFIGLDTIYHVANIMYEEYREQRFAPPPLLKKMILAGYYGRKTGKGFYEYKGEGVVPSDF